MSRSKKKVFHERVEYLRAMALTDPDWVDRPGADWEDPEYTAWVESWTDEDIERLADGLAKVCEKACRKH